MEDKLREYRFLDQTNADQKAVLLGQLDNVRRELVEVVSAAYPRIVFAKDIVREIFNFGCAGDETPRTVTTAASSPARPLKQTPGRDKDSGRGQERSSYPSPGAESSLFTILSSPKRPLPVSQPAYPSTYDNDLWEGQPPPSNRRDKLAVPVPGATSTAPGTTTTATTTRNGGVRSPIGRSLTPDGITDRDRSRRYTTSSASSHHHITDEDIYGPAEPPSRRLTATSPSATAPVGSADHGGMLRIREMLSRAEEGLTAVAEAQVQRRTPPRILGGLPEHGAAGAAGPSVGPTEDWDGIPGGAIITSNNGNGNGLPVPSSGYLTPRDGGDDLGSVWGGVSVDRRSPIHPSSRAYVRDWTIRSSTPGAPPSEAPSSRLGSAVTGMLGRLAGLVFVLGGIAVASMVASKPDAPPPGPPMRSEGRRRSSGGGNRGEEGTRRNSPSGPADMPPWLTEGDGTAANGPSTGSRVAPSGSGTSGRRKATSGRGSGGPPKSSKSSRSKAGPPGSPTQSPVMHVHQPPLTDSFPSNPPDVTAAMG